jgi:hypothetical protein
METATSTSWKIKRMPLRRWPLRFEAQLTRAELDLCLRGFIPQAMEDKWFIYAAGDWLYFHRSWTGFCIFSVQLVRTDEGARMRHAWVNRDRAQYNYTSLDDDRLLLRSLIDSRLLSRDN